MTNADKKSFSFDEEAYRNKLIAGGVDPRSAAELAAKTAAARHREESENLDLFQPVLLESKKDATRTVKAKPAKPEKPAKAIISQKEKQGPSTRSEQKLVEVGTLISTERPSGDDMAFTHAVLCQVGLPRSKVDGREFLRKSGAAWVNIQAGVLDEGNGPVLQPIPYGPMPRLALAWVSTYAKRHNTREIPIGESAAEFLRLMDMDDQGARYATLRKQMHALAACRLQLGYKGRTYNGQPIDQFDAWVSNRETQQRALWPGVMLLSDAYHKELVEHGVPLDNRALHGLKGSALALDVYTWLAHRLHRIDGRPVVLHWKSLREQFAQEYQGKDPDRDFKKRFLPALNDALAVYPQAKVKRVTGGLLLTASPPPVPYKGQ
jgi:hypothetical protein